MLKPIPFTIALTATFAIASIASGKPQPSMNQRSTRTASPSTVIRQKDDYICYYRSATGQVRDLSRFCGATTKTPVVLVNTTDKVQICYGPDNEYFPCPENEE